MKKQITDTVLMIRPVRFRTNEQTLVNNYFQKGIDITNEQINLKAQEELMPWSASSGRWVYMSS